MGRACSAHGEEEKCISDFSGKARRKETSTIFAELKREMFEMRSFMFSTQLNNTVIPFNKLSGRFKSEQSHQYKRML
jgi:hypothetical protein